MVSGLEYQVELAAGKVRIMGKECKHIRTSFFQYKKNGSLGSKLI